MIERGRKEEQGSRLQERKEGRRGGGRNDNDGDGGGDGDDLCIAWQATVPQGQCVVIFGRLTLKSPSCFYEGGSDCLVRGVAPPPSGPVRRLWWWWCGGGQKIKETGCTRRALKYTERMLLEVKAKKRNACNVVGGGGEEMERN